jgi:hypothetical protein
MMREERGLRSIIRYLIGAALLLLAIAGCSGSRGSARSHEGDCRVEGATGTCQGAFQRIRGRYVHPLDALQAPEGVPVQIELQVSVQEGALHVQLSAADDRLLAATARSGEPALLMGSLAPGIDEPLALILQVTGSRAASGVRYDIAWHPR